MKSSLENKTVRPGSLGNYSFYYSNRSLPSASVQPAKKSWLVPSTRILVVIALLIGLWIGVAQAMKPDTAKTPSAPVAATQSSKSSNKAAGAIVPTSVNNCQGNTLDKFVKVDISERHLWACEKDKQVRDAPVITGLESAAANVTPRGTFKVYGKVADTRLSGNDERGAWDYPVSYWMPYLDNEHGTYGLHDATWRPNDSFGKVDPNSSDASRGCVELPLQDMKWLYGWGDVGLSVTVES